MHTIVKSSCSNSDDYGCSGRQDKGFMVITVYL